MHSPTYQQLFHFKVAQTNSSNFPKSAINKNNNIIQTKKYQSSPTHPPQKKPTGQLKNTSQLCQSSPNRG